MERSTSRFLMGLGAGSLLGAIILYYIGRILNKERLIKIVTSKYGKLLQVKPKDIESADKWFLRKEVHVVPSLQNS